MTEINGTFEPSFAPVAEAFEKNFEEGDLGACCAVFVDGEVVVDLWGGIANSEEDPYGSGYPALTEEMVIESNPDYIVVGHSDYLNKDLSIREGWGNITAVENSNIFFLEETLASNWGTTTVQLVEEISLTFEESVQTNPYSDYLLLISLLVLVIMIYIFTRKNINQKV